MKKVLIALLLFAAGLAIGIWLWPDGTGSSKVTMEESGIPAYDPQADSVVLEGRVYHTVQFEPGGLTWMNQNLDYGGVESWYHDELIQLGVTDYGRFYTWEGAGEACRKMGWRLPSNEEWQVLIDRFGGLESGADYEGQDAYDALINNEAGDFSLTLGGYRTPDGQFGDFTSVSCYWTASEVSADLAWGYTFSRHHNFYGKVVRNTNSKKQGCFCRCVRRALEEGR